MDRRDFVKLAPAFAIGATTATLTLREEGKDPIDLDVSVLKCQPGDTLVLSVNMPVSHDAMRRIKAIVEDAFDNRVKALVLSDGLTLDGVIRA